MRLLYWILLFAMIINSIRLLPQYTLTFIKPEILALRYNTYRTCSEYGISCSLKLDSNDIAQGYANADGNEVIFTKGLFDVLNYNEIKSVLYHEIGHLALRHTDRYNRTIINKNLNSEQIDELRRQFESEADLFASMHCSKKKEKNYLIAALVRLTNGNIGIETDSHPSVKARAKTIRKLYGKDIDAFGGIE